MKTRFLPFSTPFLTSLTFLLIFCATNVATAQVPSYVPTNGLVGYWPFNGNANDESGNGNNGSFTGSSCNVCGTNQVTSPPTTIEDRFNNVNSAFEFDNQLDFISVPNSSLLQLTDEYTISTWLNSSSLDLGNFDFGVILAKWGNTGDASYQIRMSIDGYIMYDTHDGSTTTTLLSSSSLNLNQWTHVLITQQMNSVSIFINGTLDSQSSSMNTPIVSNSTVEIGRNYNQFSDYPNEGFVGTIDDIGMWNRALTQEEITILYNSCVPSLYYSDIDGDGFGAGDALNTCNPPLGYVLNNTDCNDDNANQNEGVSEVCNNQDDNCNSSIDEGLTFQNYYLDSDGDGFGAGVATSSCIALGVGYITNDTDCDDYNASVNPNAEEIGSNGIDENCDGQIDNSIEELSNQMLLYPNPATTELNLQITSDLIGTDLFVFDALGKQILKQQILSTNTIINTSTLAEGNYVVKVGGVVKRFEVRK